jgi:hypothetical protein
MSECGKWDHIYAGASREHPRSYGEKVTYAKGFVYLWTCGLIEDWGCGEGFLRLLCRKDQYRGLDGSITPGADEIVDLETYRSCVPGIFMRHVLEHNLEWKKILLNALNSFQYKMALVLFTPFADKTYNNPETIPGYEQYVRMFFKYSDICEVIDSVPGITYTTELDLPTATQFRQEHIFYLSK